MKTIHVTGETPADRSAVFALLGDSTTWPTWSPVDAVEVVAEGGDDGVGEERVITNGRYRVRERIVDRRPPRRLEYTVLSGLAVRDYHAQVHLEPSGDGTRITWHTTFRATVPGLGWLYRAALLKATRQFVDGLARRSADTASAAPPAP